MNAAHKNEIQKLSMKFVLAIFACVLVSAGLFAFWNRNVYACPWMPSDVTHPDIESEAAWRSGKFSPKTTLILEKRSKNFELPLADNWNFSEESRNRVNGVSPNYALSPEDQKRSDDSNWRTATELSKKSGYLPRN